MRRTHIYTPFARPEQSPTTDEQWQNLVATLRQERKVDEAPFIAPPHLVGYVQRPFEIDTVTRQLAPGSEVHATTVLRGLGGMGKTTLVRALASSEAVKDTFCDGVLWATLGTLPKPLHALRDLCRELGNEQTFDGFDATCGHLRALLADKRCLVIVDDAWRASDVQPFLRLGPQVATLVTTRVAEVANADPDASQLTLGEMT